MLLTATVLLAITGQLFTQGSQLAVQINLLWFPVILFGIVRLMTAYSRYLRFHWPIPTIIASQMIVCLMALAILLLLLMP